MCCVCQEEVVELNRKLTSIDSQLRKSELSRKHLEISNKKLLGFAQVELLSGLIANMATIEYKLIT